MRKIVLLVAILVAFTISNAIAGAPPPDTIKARIQKGVEWLASKQNPDGSWGTSDKVAITAFVVKKLEHHCVDTLYGLGCPSPFDTCCPYRDKIIKGFKYIFGFGNALTRSIGTQTHGTPDTIDNPDTDNDGIGVWFSGWSTYTAGIVLMAIAESRAPDREVDTLGSPVHGWTYKDVAEDVMNYLAWGQTDTGWGRGGWDYGATDDSGPNSDGSNTGYAVLGLQYAQAAPPEGFGLAIPNFVKEELALWINTIQCNAGGALDGGGGYDNVGGLPCGRYTNTLETGNILKEMEFCGTSYSPSPGNGEDPAICFLVRHWKDLDDGCSDYGEYGWRGAPGQKPSYQAMYTTTKGLVATGHINPAIIICEEDTIHWQDDFDSVIVATQNADSSWGACCWADKIVCTVWALLVLEKAVPPPSPRNKLEIGQIDSVNPGDIVPLPVLMKNPEEVGGFSFSIEYEPTSLALLSVKRGPILLAKDSISGEYDFEFFTYRMYPCAGTGCNKYKVIILGLYDLKDKHPGKPVPPRDQQDTLFYIEFKVAQDNNLRGFKIPVKWEWDEETCTENTKSDPTGNILYVSLDTTQYNFNDCPIQPGSQVYPSIYFIDGGIQIATTGEKEIGDINLNGIPFDPGDVTLFSSYFIYGVQVFVIDPPLQIALTDINWDGFTLTLSDFIYMLRVMLHDVSQPKPAPGEQVVTITAKRQNSHLTVSSDQPLGAALLLFNYTGEVKNLSSPFAINSNIGKSRDELRVLVYMKDTGGISGELLRFQATGEIKLSKVEAVDNQGRTVKVVATAKAIPDKFALYQNYPNPFNLETQISFDLPVNSKVSLKIYNITGQLVRTIIDRDMEAGEHKVIWDGKNQKGETVASGIYFYRLEAGDYVSVKKMGLVK